MAKTIALARPHDGSTRLSAAVLLAGGGAAWLYGLMAPHWVAAALAPVCGHAGALALHCPACYAAMAMIAAGAGLALTARRSARR